MAAQQGKAAMDLKVSIEHFIRLAFDKQHAFGWLAILAYVI
jgi:hypothetical protein